jgi:RNA recognition motif-containing protein
MDLEIFVAGLDGETKERHIRHWFEKYGFVGHVHILRDPETEESLGYGFVTMAYEHTGRIAIKELNGWRPRNGRRLKVKAIHYNGGCMNIWVSNLSTRMKEGDLASAFTPYGTVESVRIWVGRHNESRRFAIVRMPNHRSGKRAIENLDGEKFFGRKLWVEQASEAFAILPTLCAEASRNLGSHRKLHV